MDFPKQWLEKTDQELVRLAKDNPDYFAVLMARYSDPLARYIRRISYFTQEDIEDLLQEIFIKVYRNLNDYDQSLKFSSWIYRIAHNHIIDQFRKASSKLKTTSLENNELVSDLEFRDSTFILYAMDYRNPSKLLIAIYKLLFPTSSEYFSPSLGN